MKQKKLEKECTLTFLLSMFPFTFKDGRFLVLYLLLSPSTPPQLEISTDVEMIINTTLKTIRYFISSIQHL